VRALAAPLHRAPPRLNECASPPQTRARRTCAAVTATSLQPTARAALRARAASPAPPHAYCAPQGSSEPAKREAPTVFKSQWLEKAKYNEARYPAPQHADAPPPDALVRRCWRRCS
jgi:hypothetical protein